MTFDEAMKFQAGFCADNGAPITARVCRALGTALDDGSATGRRVRGWRGDTIADAVPLRLVAPFHALYRARRCDALTPLFTGGKCDHKAAIHVAVAEHDDFIQSWLDGPPQTNATGRSSLYVAALLTLAERWNLPFELLEIGSSAGLNLLVDRYRYDLGGVSVGPEDSSVVMRPEWRGPPPPTARIAIDALRGCDIAPIDVTDDAAAERLLAYVWVDQPERIALTEAAIALACSFPPDLIAADAADFVDARLAEPQAAGTARVLMHSIVWQYLSAATQTRIEAAITAAGADATDERPLAWIAFEVEREVGRPVLTLRTWPGDGRPRELATAHPHGVWIDWTG